MTTAFLVQSIDGFGMYQSHGDAVDRCVAHLLGKGADDMDVTTTRNPLLVERLRIGDHTVAQIWEIPVFGDPSTNRYVIWQLGTVIAAVAEFLPTRAAYQLLDGIRAATGMKDLPITKMRQEPGFLNLL